MYSEIVFRDRSSTALFSQASPLESTLHPLPVSIFYMYHLLNPPALPVSLSHSSHLPPPAQVSIVTERDSRVSNSWNRCICQNLPRRATLPCLSIIQYAAFPRRFTPVIVLQLSSRTEGAARGLLCCSRSVQPDVRAAFPPAAAYLSRQR